MGEQHAVEASPRRGRRWAVVAVLVVVVLVAVVGGLALVQRSKADDAAREYRAQVLDHVETIREGPDSPDRVAALDDRVALPTVRGGARLSGAYRDAQDLRDRYDGLLDDTAPFFREAQFIEVDSATLANGITDTIASYQGTRTLDGGGGQARRDEAASWTELADLLESQYMPAERRAAQQEAVDGYREMASSAAALAELADAGGPEADVQAAAARFTAAYGTVRAFYQDELTPYAQELADRLPDDAEDVDDAYARLIEDLGGDPDRG